MTDPDPILSQGPLLGAMLAATTDALILYDPEGRILYANPSALNPLGLDLPTVRGRTWRELPIPDTLGLPFEARLTRVCAEGQPITVEETFSRAGEPPRILESTLSPLRDATGRTTHVLNTIRDITARTQTEVALRESQARHQALLAAIPDLILLLAPDGTVEDLSASNPDLLLAPREVVLGRSLRSLMPSGIVDRILDALDRARRTQSIQVVDYPLFLKDNLRHFEARVVPCGADRLLAIAQDVTERRLAQEAFRRAEARERMILAAIPDLMFVIRRDGTVIDCHAPAPEHLAVPPEQFLGRRVQDIFEPGLTARFMAAIGQTLDHGVPSRMEYEICIGGQPQVFEARIVPYGPHQTLSMVRDITEQKAVERRLRESEGRFQLVAEHIGQLIFDYDVPTGRIVWDGAIEAITGETPAAWQLVDLQGWMDRLHPEDREATLARLEEARRVHGPYRAEYRFRHRDGAYRRILGQGAFLPEPGGEPRRMLGTMSDVTAAWEASRTLAQLQALFAAAFEQNPNGMILMSGDGQFRQINPACREILGIADEPDPPEGGPPSWRCFDPQGRELAISELPLARAVLGEHVAPGEFRILRRDGTERWILGGAQPIFDKDGSVLAGLQIFADVTERARAERALRASEDRFRALCVNTTDSIFWILVTEDGRFVVEGVNPAQLAALGQPEEQVLGREPGDFLPTEVAKALCANYRRCVEGGVPLTYDEQVDLSSGPTWWQTVLVPVKDPAGRVTRIVGTSRNVTAQRRHDEGLRQAQKLESLGVLAGGIAHDFNNLLTAMLGNLNLAQMKLPEYTAAQQHLDAIERTILKASELTRQMLAYSGRGRFVVRPLDLSQVVRETAQLLEVSIYRKIALRYDLASQLPPVEADPAQLQQVVMNLVTNASDAIGDREGVIALRTALKLIAPEDLGTLHPGCDLVPGPFVSLEVEDTGCGVPPEVLERIFDPFFTTKESGRGLGLSAMLGILRGHHGGIRIHTQPGLGSRFEVLFPAAQNPAPAAGTQSAGPASAIGGTLLLVDDDESIRDATAAALSLMGFEVLTACDGEDALAVFRTRPDLRLVLMDLTMPRLDGREAFLAMHALRPEVPVLLSSGYSEEESVPGLQPLGLAGFLQKPYQIKELRSVLARLLGSA